jgi:tetratricopeptide (TPR) repeat protein
MQSAVAMQRTLRGNEPYPDLAEVLNDMGAMLWQHGDLDPAEKFYREALAMNRRLLGDKHPEIATGLENVGTLRWDRQDLAGAEALYQQSLEMRRELLGENHPEVGQLLFNLATLQYDRGRTSEARANLRKVLAIYRKAYPPDHPETAAVLNVVGFWLTLAGEYEEADRYLQEGLAMRHRLFGEQHQEVASSLTMVAVLRVAERKYPEALELAQSAKGIYTVALSPDHWHTAMAESAEGAALAGLGRYAEAETHLKHSYGILSGNSGALLAFRNLAQHYMDALHRRAGRERGTTAPSAATLAAEARASTAPAPQQGPVTH